MADLVIVGGRSGSGKSTSGRTLDPKTTYWINADQKALPFRGWMAQYNSENKNYSKTSGILKTIEILRAIPKKLPHIKVVILDTLNRMMTDKVMADRNIKGYDKWAHLSGGIYDIFSVINTELPEDMIVFVLAHTEEGFDDSGAQYRKVMTAGKQLDKIVLESMSSIVLFTKVEAKGNGKNEYYFQTQTDGVSTAKSPDGMFNEFLIPNDLQVIVDSIRKYNRGE